MRRPHPVINLIRRLDGDGNPIGDLGSEFFSGLDSIEEELPIPADHATVRYRRGITSGLPDYVQDFRGVVAEYGDGNTSPPAAGMLSQGRSCCAGIISDIYVDTRDYPTQLTCTCQLDILINGVSIFGAGSTLPFITAGTSYHDTTFTGTVTRTIAKGDRITVRLISYSGLSKGLDLTILIG